MLKSLLSDMENILKLIEVEYKRNCCRSETVKSAVGLYS